MDSREAALVVADMADRVAAEGVETPLAILPATQFAMFIEERKHLVGQVAELQARMTAMTLERQQRANVIIDLKVWIARTIGELRSEEGDLGGIRSSAASAYENVLLRLP